MYKVLDIKKTNELYLVKQGWFSPDYDLTDNIYGYGRITFHRFSMRRATAITANETWVFKREGIFSGTTLITDQNDLLIGRAIRYGFGRKITLTLQTGFQAEFYRPSIWSREYNWESIQHGKIMHIHSYPLNLRDNIYVDQSPAPGELIPLLIFLGGYLVILSRRRKASH